MEIFPDQKSGKHRGGALLTKSQPLPVTALSVLERHIPKQAVIDPGVDDFLGLLLRDLWQATLEDVKNVSLSRVGVRRIKRMWRRAADLCEDGIAEGFIGHEGHWINRRPGFYGLD